MWARLRGLALAAGGVSEGDGRSFAENHGSSLSHGHSQRGTVKSLGQCTRCTPEESLEDPLEYLEQAAGKSKVILLAACDLGKARAAIAEAGCHMKVRASFQLHGSSNSRTIGGLSHGPTCGTWSEQLPRYAKVRSDAKR